MRQIIILLFVLLFAIAACEDKSTEPFPLAFDKDRYPTYSNDGSRLLFVHYQVPPDTLPDGMYFFNFADSSVELFLAGKHFDSPSFSPDDRWIVFGLNGNIFMIKPNGDSLTSITNSEDNLFPDWSSSSDMIAYTNLGGDDRGIRIIDLKTMTDSLIISYDIQPSWFPDNQRLVTKSYNFPPHSEVAIVDIDGNILERLTENESHKDHPTVSPDGNYICFAQDFPETYNYPELWTMDLQSKQSRRLTYGGGNYPDYSPDGEWIVYTHVSFSDGTLWIMRSDGSQQRRLVNY